MLKNHYKMINFMHNLQLIVLYLSKICVKLFFILENFAVFKKNSILQHSCYYYLFLGAERPLLHQQRGEVGRISRQEPVGEAVGPRHLVDRAGHGQEWILQL